MNFDLLLLLIVEALPTEIVTTDKEWLWIQLKLLVLFLSKYDFNN